MSYDEIYGEKDGVSGGLKVSSLYQVLMNVYLYHKITL